MSDNVVLTMFFSHGVSLETWDTVGLFDREVGYYQALARAIGPVSFVTYDRPGPALKGLLSRAAPISVVYNRWKMPYQLYGFLAPLLHAGALRNCGIFKSNQISGSWAAAIAAKLFRRPLIVRCGFVKEQMESENPHKHRKSLLAALLEKFALKTATFVFVATEQDRRYLAETYRLPLEKFRVLGNAIDCDRFRPLDNVCRQPRTVVHVGRLQEQKNLELLIEACKQVKNVRLLLAGVGPEEERLRECARGSDVEFLGAVPNRELPELLNSAEVFALVSRYEGLPKALLEAMACGMAVVGTDVVGTREVIRHEENGLLCKPEKDSIAAAIERLLNDAELRRRLGAAARQYVVNRYSQAAIVRTEAEIIRRLSGRK